MGRRTSNGLGPAALAGTTLVAAIAIGAGALGACDPAPSDPVSRGPVADGTADATAVGVPAAAREAVARGREAELRGQRFAAIAEYGRAIEAAPDWAEPHRLRVPLARAGGDLATARDSLLWLLEHEPRTTSHGAALVQVGMRLGDLELARRGLSRLAALEPDRARTHQAAARVAFEDGRLSLAGREARLAIQKDPSLAEAHYILGVVADERGNESAALAAWERALAADPGHLGARDLFATALLRAGRAEEAAEQRELHGRITSVHAAGFKKLDAAARARILEPLIEELPPWPYGEVELARAWMELDRNKQALPLLRSVLKQENTGATHALLYEVLTALGKYQAAERHGRLAGLLPADGAAQEAAPQRADPERRP